MELRTLYPETDEWLYRAAWEWRLKYPRLVRKWDCLKHFRYWFRLMKRRVSIGVFAPKLIALITFQPKGSGVYEVHVDCERRTDKDLLLLALLNVRRTVFEQWKAQEIFAGIVSRNNAIITIAEQCGFRRDGVSETLGRTKWVRLRITKDEFNQNEYQHRNERREVLAD